METSVETWKIYDSEIESYAVRSRLLKFKAEHKEQIKQNTFAQWSPCIYMGAILCNECSRKNYDGDGLVTVDQQLTQI